MALGEGSSPRTISSFYDGSDVDSEDEMDWEEVIVPKDASTELATTNGASGGEPSHLNVEQLPSSDAVSKGKTIEITLQSGKKVNEKSQARVQAYEERQTRLICHRLHTVALLGNALARNRWINTPLLKARLMSITPLSLQVSFTSITKKRFPDAPKRGRLFETAMMHLTQWWYENFDITGLGIRSRPFSQVQQMLLNGESWEDHEDHEIIRSPNSLMKRAIIRRGNRDTSAQLFTSLCRALGIPSRLVVSLQGVPWQASVGKPKPKSRTKLSDKKGKGKAIASDNVEASDSSDNDDMEEIEIPSTAVDRKGKGRASFPGEGVKLSGGKGTTEKPTVAEPVIRLRKSHPAGRRLGSSTSRSRQSTPLPPVGGFPPVFWTEVFSRPDGRWMPVDPTRSIVNKRKVFDPPSHDKSNRMVYVVAVEEDGYCRDVTQRYAREYSTKTAKAQHGGKKRKEWWGRIISSLERPYRLHRDDQEDEEFQFNQVTEGMPTSITGFKDHPVYALEQHLKREEIIFPKTEIGKFRGESVYPRSNVISLKTAENWMRIGRKVKEGFQPMKWVKQRAVTIHRRRAMELAQQEGDEMMQGLYSEGQTELYIPDPIVDGKVPKNDFGNIDLYTPTMLPEGASHLPFKGIAKIAKKLGFDYAEAVTGFEFKKGRAFPILDGIVVAKENEESLIEAFLETERDAEERERLKRRERVLKRWTKLIQGLRIRQRLQEQYAGGNGSAQTNQDILQEPIETAVDAGGFIMDEADTVVQPFHLPRFEHGVYKPYETKAGTALETDELLDKLSAREASTTSLPGLYELTNDDDKTTEEVPENETTDSLALDVDILPRTMRELAESSALKLAQVPQNPSNGIPTKLVNNSELKGKEKEEGPPSAVLPSTDAHPKRRTRQVSLRVSAPDSNSSNDDSKATRAKRRRSEPQTPAPTTRVLRARLPKSAEKLREERDADESFRKAIAE